MKTKVLLIRHGETEWNKELRFQGVTDIPLCEEGIKQAHLLAKRLHDKLDVIYASPLNRAFHTARILGDESSLNPIICEDIREINYGNWEGHTFDKIKSEFPTEYHTLKHDKKEGLLMGGDFSIKNASERGSKAILNIVNENKGKTIAIVAHGGIIKASLIGLFHWDMTMYHSFFIGNTSITTLSFQNNDRPVILGVNDNHHLDIL